MPFLFENTIFSADNFRIGQMTVDELLDHSWHRNWYHYCYDFGIEIVAEHEYMLFHVTQVVTEYKITSAVNTDTHQKSPNQSKVQRIFSAHFKLGMCCAFEWDILSITMMMPVQINPSIIYNQWKINQKTYDFLWDTKEL